jgi:hypothetical protein
MASYKLYLQAVPDFTGYAAIVTGVLASVAMKNTSERDRG